MKKLFSRVLILLLVLCVFNAHAAPAISVTSNPTTAYYKAGETVQILVTFPSAVAVSGTPLLALNSGGTAQYSSENGATLTFLYTVNNGDTSALLDYTSITALTLNGGSIDTPGTRFPVSLTLPAPGSAGSLSANASVVIDTTPPSITISAPSATAAGAGGSVSYTVTYADANFSRSVLSTKFIALTDPSVTGTITVTRNSATVFTVTISNLGGSGSQAIQIFAGTADDFAGNVAPAAGPSASFTVSTRFSVSAPATITAGSAFSGTVVALDALGNVATGYSGTVHFTSTDGSATLPADSSLTAGMGTFTFTLKTAGNQTVTATDTTTSSITGTSGNVTVVPAAASRFSVVLPQSASAGAPFSGTINALDAFNNIASTYSGTVHFTSSDKLAVLPANSTLNGGIGTFNFTLKTLGNETVTATDSTTSSITGTGNVSVMASVATHFSVSVPATTTAGVAFNGTVTALDALGNVATSYAGTVHFTSTDGAASLPADSMLTAGVKTFSFTLQTAGNQTVTAIDNVTSSIKGTSSSVAVSAGAATHFSVVLPASASAGVQVSGTVTAFDQFNNIAASYLGTVHFTSSDASATLPANSTLTAGTGMFNFTLRTVGNQTVTATDSTTSSITGTSGDVNVTVAVATRLSVVLPATATAGNGFNATVTALNAFGSVATGYSGTVHFTSTDGSAALPINSTLAGGMGTFIFILKTTGNQTVTAADTVTPSITGTSGNVTVAPAAATHFAVVLPQSASAGAPFSGTVTALDPFGNTATSFSGNAHFTSSDGSAVLPADAPLVNGTKTFTFTLETPGNQTVSATSTGTPAITGTSGNINVIFVGAAQFAIVVPASTVAGEAFSGTVTALDPSGGVATAYTGAVHFTSSDAAAALPADTTLNNGVGTFSFTLQTPGSQTVAATDAASSSVTGTSSAIIVVAPAPGSEVYVSDIGNNTVSKISSTGTVTPFVTNGLNAPEGLAFDSVGNLYIANNGADTISMVTPAGVASTFATGFQSPTGLAFDGGGTLYVANSGSGAISKVDPSGVVTTLSSNGLTTPIALAIDSSNDVYVTDLGAGAIVRVTPSGAVSSFVTGLSYPSGLAIGDGGNLFVARNSANAISEITPGGLVSPFVTAGLRSPYGLAFDGENNLYAANQANGTISLITPDGTMASFASGFLRPEFVAVAPVNGVVSINRNSASPTNAASVSWTVTFTGAVSNLTSANFLLVNTGLSGAPAITGVSPLGSLPSANWTVTASAGTGTGALGLNLVSATGLALPVTNLTFVGQVYSVDTVPPLVTISPPSATITTGGPVAYTVTFSDANLGETTLPLASIQINQAGTASDGKLAVAPSGGSPTSTNYIVTLSDLSGNGTIGITIPAGAAFDLAGNQSPAATSATFMQVHNPPFLAPITNYTINEDALLTVTNAAADTNFPPLPLTFSLGPGAPANAAIDPVTGIFQWRPTSAQAPGTDVISVIVTDTSIPPLSATQQFTVFVVPVPSVFALGLGNTNVLLGETNFVPITLTSQLALTNVMAVLQAPTNNLSNLTVSAVSPEVAAASLQPLGAGRYAVSLALIPPANPNGARVIANLNFTAVPQVESAIVPLLASQALALQVDGTAAAQAITGNGQVIIVGVEPILVPSLGVDLSRILTIYANPGSNYELESITNFSSTNWQSVGNVIITNEQQNVNVDQTTPHIFYRLQ